jgi:hypothetical protein
MNVNLHKNTNLYWQNETKKLIEAWKSDGKPDNVFASKHKIDYTKALRAVRLGLKKKRNKYYYGLGYDVGHESHVRWELSNRLRRRKHGS